MGLALTAYDRGEHVVVTVGGDIDVFTAPQLRDYLRDLLDTRGVDLILDFSRVGLMDSSGLGVLVGIHHRAQALHGSLRLAHTSAHVERQLATTGLDTMLPTHPTTEAAANTPLPHPGGADAADH